MASRRDNSDAFADSDILDKDCIPPFEYDDDVCDTRLPERWFCRNHYPTGRKLHSYSKTDYLVELSLALKDHKEEMDKILNSQFGKLFDVPLRRLAFSGQLVHGLLTRQLQCYRRHERWFIFGPKPIKFSLREFYLVTGLKCDPYDKSSPEAAGSVSEEQEGDALNLSEEQPVDPPQVAASHWDTLIAAGQMGKDGSIDQLINRLKSGEQMEGDTRLQLALVILADGVVAVENQNGKVSRKTVELVKDVDKFLSYSWGRKAFELTMLNFTDMVRNKRMKDRLTMPSISMRGFPIAIQLLALEAILELQAKLPSAYAELDFTPRSCSGLYKKKTIDYKDLINVESLPELTVDSILHASGEEVDPKTWEWSDDDEEEDESIAYLEAILKEGNASIQLNRRSWPGGDRSWPRLLTRDEMEVYAKNKEENERKKSELKGKGKKRARSSADVAGPSAKRSLSRMDEGWWVNEREAVIREAVAESVGCSKSSWVHQWRPEVEGMLKNALDTLIKNYHLVRVDKKRVMESRQDHVLPDDGMAIPDPIVKKKKKKRVHFEPEVLNGVDSPIMEGAQTGRGSGSVDSRARSRRSSRISDSVGSTSKKQKGKKQAETSLSPGMRDVLSDDFVDQSPKTRDGNAARGTSDKAARKKKNRKANSLISKKKRSGEHATLSESPVQLPADEGFPDNVPSDELNEAGKKLPSDADGNQAAENLHRGVETEDAELVGRSKSSGMEHETRHELNEAAENIPSNADGNQAAENLHSGIENEDVDLVGASKSSGMGHQTRDELNEAAEKLTSDAVGNQAAENLYSGIETEDAELGGASQYSGMEHETRDELNEAAEKLTSDAVGNQAAENLYSGIEIEDAELGGASQYSGMEHETRDELNEAAEKLTSDAVGNQAAENLHSGIETEDAELVRASQSSGMEQETRDELNEAEEKPTADAVGNQAADNLHSGIETEDVELVGNQAAENLISGTEQEDVEGDGRSKALGLDDGQSDGRNEAVEKLPYDGDGDQEKLPRAMETEGVGNVEIPMPKEKYGKRKKHIHARSSKKRKLSKEALDKEAGSTAVADEAGSTTEDVSKKKETTKEPLAADPLTASYEDTLNPPVPSIAPNRACPTVEAPGAANTNEQIAQEAMMELAADATMARKPVGPECMADSLNVHDSGFTSTNRENKKKAPPEETESVRATMQDPHEDANNPACPLDVQPLNVFPVIDLEGGESCDREYPRRGGRPKARNPFFDSPFVNPFRQKRLGEPNITPLYDVTSDDTQASTEAALRFVGEEQITLRTGQVLTASAIHGIGDSGANLDYVQMRVMLSLVWNRHEMAYRTAQITIADSLFADTLLRTYGEFESGYFQSGYGENEFLFKWPSLLVEYVSGCQDNGLPQLRWGTDAKTIYMPMRWHDDRWVGLIINVQSRKVELLDTGLGDSNREEVANAMLPFTTMLPYILNQIGRRKKITKPIGPWKYRMRANVVQNIDLADSGPVIVKLLEMLSTNCSKNEVRSISEASVAVIRAKFASDVINDLV